VGTPDLYHYYYNHKYSCMLSINTTVLYSFSRCLATGSSFASMTVPFHMSKTSIARHVLVTCDVLWKVLQPIEMPFPNKDEWKRLAKRFGDLWDYPFAIGSLDGKHVALVNPMNSESLFYNYKGFSSIVLLALSDADSCFTLVDCGQYGRVSDAGVFQASRISQLLDQERLNIPDESFVISTSEQRIPFQVLGDEAFPLKKNLMKPYAARTLDRIKRIYNYRHCRARRPVECTFGIMAKKFEIFQRPMRLQPDKAITVTNACTVLHNFIRRRDGHMIDRSSEITYDIRPNNEQGLMSLRPQQGGRNSDKATEMRDLIAEFFNDPRGSVMWQDQNVFRNVLLLED